MKKTIKWIMCGAVAAFVLGGCSKSNEGQSAADQVRQTVEIADGNIATGANADKVTLGNYKAVEIPAAALIVTDDEVEQEIQALLSEASEDVSVTDRPAQEGDTVIIDFVGKKDNVAFEGGTGTDYPLTLGSGSFIPGFEEGLIGANVGEVRDLDLTFPEDYGSEELAGAATVFTVTVKGINAVSTPELNEEFVKARSETAATVEAYREEVKQQLIDYYKKDAALKVAINDSTFELTAATYEESYQQAVSYVEQQFMMYYGVGLEQMISTGQIDQASFEADLHKDAENSAKFTMLFDEVAKAENLQVTEQDIEDLAKDTGVYENGQAMLEAMGEDTVNDYVLQMKVIEFLAENAVVK